MSVRISDLVGRFPTLTSVPELKGVGQKGVKLCPHHWLDVVLPGDSLLQKEMGRGQKNRCREPPEPARLPRELLGTFQLQLHVCTLLPLLIISLFFPWGQFLLFCEGTRFTPKKHQISMQVAESKGLPKLKYHLLPRTKGFWVTVQNLRGTGEQWGGLHAFATQIVLRLTVAMRRLQLQPCTTPV